MPPPVTGGKTQLPSASAMTDVAKLQVSSSELEEKLSGSLHDIGLKQREEVVQKAAAKAGVPYISLMDFPITQEALKLVDVEEAKRLRAFCFYLSTNELRIAAIVPEDKEVEALVKRLEDKQHAKAVIYQISEESFRIALERYATLPKIAEFKDEVAISDEAVEKYRALIKDEEQLKKVLETASMTDIVAIIVAAALELKSSDIHIEAEEKRIAVRFRIDGVLQEISTIPKERWKQMIARFKLVAGLKINVNDVPQDGRFTIAEEGKKIDVRVSTMPTVFGESLVMRILKPMANVEFEGLGIRGTAFKRLNEQTEMPNGMIITTGPTGSGKTTTLYSILIKLNKPGVKIITMEDPVEYKLSGINQSQVDVSKGYTFAKGLKSILRQDPDIVMVGEIRELETAEIAIQAAMTGHLMISTIHTNSAAGAIPRFLSMGVKPFLLAPALNAILGQRLARRLCECKKQAQPDKGHLARVEKTMAMLSPESGEVFDMSKATWYGPTTGCDKCHEGYSGRVGVYEVLIMTKEIEKSILSEKVSEYDILEIAIKQGMVTMLQDGILKAAEGITSLEEVLRVINE